MPKVFKNKKTLYLSSIFIAGIVIILSLFIFQKNQEGATATEWYDESWYYRKAIEVGNYTGAELTDFQVQILTNQDLSTDVSAGKIRSDLGDLRFLDANGNQLEYWVEDDTTNSVDIWIKKPTVSVGTSTVYMYYGNPTATTAQIDADSMFEFFDDFDGTALDENTWETMNAGTGSTVVSGGTVTVSSVGDWWANSDTSRSIVSKASFGNQYVVEGKVTSLSATGHHRFFGLRSSADASAKVFVLLADSDGTHITNVYRDTVAVAANWYGENSGIAYPGVANAMFRVNGDTVTSYYNDVVTNQRTVSGWNLQHIGITDTHDADGFSMDWVLVRKYASSDPVVLAVGVASEEQGPGPVGYWSFDEGTGTTASDMTVNNNDGTITGATWKNESECVSGKCLSFDGSGDYVDMGDVHDIGTNDMTISAWVKTTNNSGSSVYFISKARAAFQNYRYAVGMVDGSMRVFMQGNSGSDVLADGSKVISDNTWHHIGVIYDRDGTIYVYVDGVLDATAVISQWNGLDFQSNNPFRIGSYTASDNTTPSNLYIGLIDEVKIYNYARTPDQIKQDYNQGKAVFFGSTAQNDTSLTDGLIGYWKFDESTANTCTGGVNDSCDSSGLGNDGAWNGDASATTTAKFGRGVQFDGDGDYIDMGDLGLDGTSAITKSIWFKTTDTSGTLIDVENGAPRDAGFWIVSGYLTADIDFTTNGSKTIQMAPTAGVADNVWHQAVFTYDGEYLRTYLDGYATGTPVYAPNDTLVHSANTIIGRRIVSTSYYYDGAIDEVRIYNRALNPEEVRRLYEYAPGPVGWWKLDENSGTSSVYDSSGNGNTGTMNGSMTAEDWVEGKYGSALEFDGNDDRVLVAGSEVINPPVFTFSYWVYDSGQDANYERISSKTSYRFDTAVDVNGQVKYYPNTSWVSTGYNLPRKTWTYLTWVDDGSTIYLYANGSQVHSKSGSFSLQDSDSWFFGTNPSGTEAFNGLIDDVRIYNYARTQKQILEDMHAGRPNQPVAYYSFDEMQGTTAYDRGYLATDFDSGNNGTLTNMSTSGTSTAWTQNGKKGGALSFDGVDDYVNISHSSRYNFSANTGFAISTWFKTSDDYGPLVSLRRDSTGTPVIDLHVGYSGLTTAAGKLVFLVRDNVGTLQEIISDKRVDDGQWHQVIAMRLDDGATQIFLDGEKVAENTNSGPTSSITTDKQGIGTDLEWVEATFTTEDKRYLQGDIDEFKIYNYALSLDEIRQEYNSGAQIVLSKSAEEVQQVTEGLVGHWKMDEPNWSGNSGEVIDSSGSGNHGTRSGDATTSATAKYGRAGTFDGTGDYVTVSDDNSLDLGQGANKAITIQSWFKTTSSGLSHAILTKRDADASGNTDYMIFMESNKLYWGTGSSADSCAWQFTTEPSSGVWHHVVGVLEATGSQTGRKRMYVDGVEVGNCQYNVKAASNSGSLFIGKIYGSSFYFNGQIDDVKIYNYARTPDQIMSDYVDGPPPIGHWDFDEGGGSTAADKSGNGNTGTVTGAEFDVDGKLGNALKFDGSGDYVNVPDADMLDTEGQLSISLWFNRSQTTHGGIISKWSSGGSNDGWFIEPFETATTWRTYFKFSDATTMDWNVSVEQYIQNNQWHHYVLTYDNSSFKVYIDGTLIATNSSYAGKTINPNIRDVKIGLAQGTSGGNWYWNGYIDEVKLYNYALTPRQVMQEYNGGGPVAWYKFDEGEGIVAYDHSGNGNDASITIGPAGNQTATSSAWSNGVNGKLNGSINLGGTDDYIRITNTNAIKKMAAEGTLSAWVNPNYLPNSSTLATIVDVDRTGCTTSGLYWFFSDSYAKLQYGDGSVCRNVSSSEKIPLSQWTHVAVTWDASGAAMYVNGELNERNNYPRYNAINNSTSVVGSNNGTGRFYDGKIDDLKFFNYALTPVEIKKEYNSGFVNYFQ